MIQFVAFDGEGLSGKTHEYVLLADSLGASIKAGSSGFISWEEALPFLTRPQLTETTNVWFAMNYDINMLGKHEPEGFKRALYEVGEADYMTNDGVKYHLKYIPRKVLRIRRGDSKHRSWVHYDSWGFYQASFEKALADWKLAEDPIIAEGKQRREAFKFGDLDFMVTYNAAECKALVALMEALYRKLEAVNLIPSGYHGAGALASKLLSESKCREPLRPKMFKQLDTWQRVAYFGGRVELVRRGKFDHVYSYDINSAYPHSTLALPAINGAWEKCDGADLAHDDFALAEVSWYLESCRIGPLPYRLDSGYVVFPSYGRGIYHNVEVQAALKYIKQWGIKGDFKLGRALRLKRPYTYPLHDYVTKRAAQRLEYKRKKDFAHIPIKLGLNALYGKFAQRPQKSQQHPLYRQLLVAGYITAHTRAECLLSCDPESVVLFATDSVKSLTPLNLPEGEDLGEWEASIWDEAIFLMAGVYAYKEESEWHKKTRGVHDLDIDKAYHAALRGETMVWTEKQFMGIKRSLANYKAYPEPCRFYPLSKTIDWENNNKRNTWATDGGSWPNNEFVARGILSTPYTTKFDEEFLEEGDE